MVLHRLSNLFYIATSVLCVICVGFACGTRDGSEAAGQKESRPTPIFAMNQEEGNRLSRNLRSQGRNADLPGNRLLLRERYRGDLEPEHYRYFIYELKPKG